MCNIRDPFGLEEGEYSICFQRMRFALGERKKHGTIVENI